MAWIRGRAFGWVLGTRGEEFGDAEITLGGRCEEIVFGVLSKD